MGLTISLWQNVRKPNGCNWFDFRRVHKASDHTLQKARFSSAHRGQTIWMIIADLMIVKPATQQLKIICRQKQIMTWKFLLSDLCVSGRREDKILPALPRIARFKFSTERLGISLLCYEKYFFPRIKRQIQDTAEVLGFLTVFFQFQMNLGYGM